MKHIKLTLSILILLTSIFLCHKIITVSTANQQHKLDIAELNHIRYGLFSVDRWKVQISKIIADEINKLYFTNANEKDLKSHVEIQLNTLIDNIEKRVQQGNEGSAGGWVKQSLINTFIDMKEIKQGIPEYADAIILEMTKRQTEVHLKTILKERIAEYFKETFDLQDLAPMKSIMVRNGFHDLESAKAYLVGAIAKKSELINQATLALITLSIILFVLSGFSKQLLLAPQFFLLILSLTVLLIAGVTIPMIDMEAKISQMNFMLLDHKVLFENQVLYFQSKSILDVFWIMIVHKDIQMKLVGILMIAFSIVFPVLKMFSSFVYFYNYRSARENRLIKFFVLKSGKWSMADVLVIAIFMAYIGFNGIITSQFGNISSENQELVVLATNGTSLQPGFYLFMTYSLLALFLSGFLTKIRAS